MISIRKRVPLSRQAVSDEARRRRIVSLGDSNLPAIDAVLSYRRRPRTDLNLLMATRAATVWRDADWRDLMKIGRRYLLWPLRLPIKIVRAMDANAEITRLRYGRSRIGQLSDMLRIAIRHGLMPDQYYSGALARYGGGVEISRYVSPALVRAVIAGLSPEPVPFLSRLINNKSDFERRCLDAGLPTVRTIAIVSQKGSLVRIDSAQGNLPDRDFIVKPNVGGRGQGIECFRSAGAGRFTIRKGATLSNDDLVSYVTSIAASRGVAMLVQERLENHPDLQPVVGSALATTRVVTILDEQGEPEVVDAFFRTSVTPNAIVDNFHHGGMLFPIDIESGTLGPGLTDRPFDPKLCTDHPETGQRVAERVHPAWRPTRELACRLHRLYPGHAVVGSDIGFTPDGVVAVEVNETPGFSVNRQATFGGLVGTRTLALLAVNALRWLERNEPANSRWRSNCDSTGRDKSSDFAHAARATSRSPSASRSSPPK